jgi:hypothetical protein
MMRNGLKAAGADGNHRSGWRFASQLESDSD